MDYCDCVMLGNDIGTYGVNFIPIEMHRIANTCKFVVASQLHTVLLGSLVFLQCIDLQA